MKMDLDSYKSGTKIKSVTSLPKWANWIRGRMDSGKGESVAMAHITLLLDRCAELETLECLAAEDLLYETRKKGADALATIKNSKELVENFPGLVTENGPADIRENARRLAKKKAAEEDAAEAKKELFVIDETLTNVNTILHERILRTRKEASEVIDRYISGLRTGNLMDFDADITFSEKAAEEYHNRHHKTDEAIRSMAVWEEAQV